MICYQTVKICDFLGEWWSGNASPSSGSGHVIFNDAAYADLGSHGVRFAMHWLMHGHRCASKLAMLSGPRQ